MRTAVAVRSLLFSFVLLTLSHVAVGQIGVGISVRFGPPALPVYEQPICPADGLLWTPGYWAYDDDDGYYWVPGTWVEAPEPGFLWTPGYWGWGNGFYIWNAGYWGPHVGFYGGINYGFGYFGVGFGGGEWRSGTFFYNTAAWHVNNTVIRNVYVNNTVIVNNTSHVAFNGPNGIQARPTSQEEQFSHESHLAPVAAQTQHVEQARANPQLRASANQGKPPIAATARAGDFKTGVVETRQAGGEYKAPPPNAARGAEGHPANEGHPGAAEPAHASELQQHTYTPPNTGDAKADKKYQQQQQKLTAQQAKDHQKLQQQQEKEHQQAAQKSYNDAQKQQMEQRHTQQTQQLEQKHATQQTQLQQRQPVPRPPAGKPH